MAKEDLDFKGKAPKGWKILISSNHDPGARYFSHAQHGEKWPEEMEERFAKEGTEREGGRE